jgi:hypothetical protein
MDEMYRGGREASEGSAAEDDRKVSIKRRRIKSDKPKNSRKIRSKTLYLMHRISLLPLSGLQVAIENDYVR